MSVYGCVWGYWCAGSTILCTERHGGTNMCLIWGSAWPGNFPGHHVLTCMTQKNEKRVTSTQYMGQGPHNTCIQLKQKQTWPKSIIKLAQPINSDTYNFWQKHNNTKLGVLIDQKKNIQATKPVANLFWTRNNTYTVQANAAAKQQQQKTSPADKNRDLYFSAETQQHQIRSTDWSKKLFKQQNL